MSVPVRLRAEIRKVHEDKRFVWARAYTSLVGGRPVVDADGDVVEPDELEEAAWGFDGVVKESHRGRPVGRLVESVVTTPEKAEAMGLPSGSDVAWWVGLKIEDAETWRRVKSRELAEISFGGEADRVPVERPADAVEHPAGSPRTTWRLQGLRIEELSLVAAGAGVRVPVALTKGRRTLKMMTPEDFEKLAAIREKLSPEEFQLVLGAISQAQAAGAAAAEVMPTEEPVEEPEKMDEDVEAEKADDESDKMDGMYKALKKEREEREKLAAELARERQDRLVEKAKVEIARERPGVPLDADLHAEIRLAARAVAKSSAPTMLSAAAVKAVDELLGKVGSLIKESAAMSPIGSSRPGGADTALAEIERRAAELTKSNPHLAPWAAMAEVLKGDPALAKRYQKESI